jgi:FixJ family two-component response regulator
VVPGSGGGELAEAMKSRGYDIPIVFISGYPRDAVVAKGITDLEFTYLAKPFSPSQLLSTVREKLAAARPRVPFGRGRVPEGRAATQRSPRPGEVIARTGRSLTGARTVASRATR